MSGVANQAPDILGRPHRVAAGRDGPSRSGDSGGTPLQVVVQVLRRRILVVALCALLVPGVALALSLREQKRYTASASVLFRTPQLDATLFGASPRSSSVDPLRGAATDVGLASLPAVAQRTASLLGLSNAGIVSGDVSVSAAGNSDLISITANDVNRQFAAKLANTYALASIQLRQEAERANVLLAQAAVGREIAGLSPADRSGVRGTTLSQRYDQLTTLAALETGNTDLVRPASVPLAASSPKVRRNVVLAGVLGLLLGLCLAFVRDLLDPHLNEPKEIEEAFGLPILGTIPQSRSIRKLAVPALLDLRVTSGVEREAFRALRARLRHAELGHQIRTVLVASAAPQDGRTSVSLGLAGAAARSGQRVLFIEADFRRPALGTHLSDKGLSLVLGGLESFEDAVVELGVAQPSLAAGPASASRTRSLCLHVLPSGPLPPDAGVLIESDEMLVLIAQAEERYDLVVIDTPPISVAADALSLAGHVNGVLIVTRLGRNTRDMTTWLCDQLSDLHAAVLGIVVNGTKSPAFAVRQHLRVRQATHVQVR
jgi:capsular exopolysaccharide synthesis family protein